MKAWNADFNKKNSAAAICNKDFQLVGWLLAVWIVLIWLQFIFQIVGTMGLGWVRDTFYFEVIYPIVVWIFGVLPWILIAIIIPTAVQSDAIIDTKAFWLTKPISRENLFKAKLHSCTLFVWMFAWLLVIQIHDISAFFHWGSFVVIVWLIAALTSSLRNYLLVMTLGLGAVGLGSMIVIAWTSNAGLLITNSQRVSFGYLTISLWSILEIVFIIGGLNLLGFLYTKNCKKSLRLCIPHIVGLLGIILLGSLFNSPTLSDKKQDMITDLKSEYKIIMDLNEVRIEHSSVNERLDQKTVLISTRVNMSGLPKGQFAVIKSIDAALMKYQDSIGINMSLELPSSSILSYRDERLVEPLQKSLKDTRLLNAFVNRFNVAPIFKLSEADYQSVKGKQGIYAAAIKVDVYDYCKQEHIPLDLPSVKSEQHRHNRVVEKIKGADGLTVILYENKNRFCESSNEGLNTSMANGDVDFKQVYFLVNSKTQEAFIAEAVRPSTLSVLPLGNFGSQIPYLIKRIDFTFINDRNVGLPVLDDQWLKDAHLVRVSARYLKTIEKPIEFKNFYLPAKESFGTEVNR